MRSSPFLASAAVVGALVSCGGSSEQKPPASVPVVVPTASAAPSAPAPVAEPAVEPMMPHGAALVAALDLSALDTEIRTSRDLFRAVLAEFPFLTREQLIGGVSGIGVDASRPALFAVARPHDAATRAVASLPQQPRPQETRDVVANPGAAEAMSKAVAGLPSFLAVRVIVPVTDAAAFRRTLTATFEKNRFRAEAGGVWVRGEQLVALSGNDRAVAIDVINGNDVKAGLAALRADVAASAPGDALALEGRTARVVYSPRQLATYGILAGAMMTVGAVSSASLEPAAAARIASMGLYELMQWRTITESSAGPYIDRVEVSLTRRDGKVELTERLETGSGWTFGPDEAWTPSPSIKVEGADMQLDVSTAFLGAVPLPPTDPKDQSSPFRQFMQRTREAGWGTPVINGHILLAGIHEFFDRARFSDMLDRRPFERMGVFTKGPGASLSRPGFFGVLPAKTTRAAAECALAPKAPCDAKRRLKLDATVAVGKEQGRLVQVGDRFVVLVSPAKDALVGKLTATTAGAAAGHASLVKMFGPTPTGGMLMNVDNVDVAVERDGKTITLRARSLLGVERDQRPADRAQPIAQRRGGEHLDAGQAHELRLGDRGSTR